MKVKAIELGFYGEKRRRPDSKKDSIFTLKNVADFAPEWMRVVQADASERQELRKALEARQTYLADPKSKRIYEAEHKFSRVKQDFSAKDQFDELFDEEEVSDKKSKKAAAKVEADEEEAEPVVSSSDEEEAL